MREFIIVSVAFAILFLSVLSFTVPEEQFGAKTLTVQQIDAKFSELSAEQLARVNEKCVQVLMGGEYPAYESRRWTANIPPELQIDTYTVDGVHGCVFTYDTGDAFIIRATGPEAAERSKQYPKSAIQDAL
jgi:hypothetical protein